MLTGGDGILGVDLRVSGEERVLDERGGVLPPLREGVVSGGIRAAAPQGRATTGFQGSVQGHSYSARFDGDLKF